MNIDDKPHEECGIVGAFIPGESVARTAFFGLFALQHRGQESAGIATSEGDEIRLKARMGLVSQVFHEETLAGLPGHLGIATPVIPQWAGVRNITLNL